MHRSTVVAIALSFGFAAEALAQTTGMPSFNAPYRAFTRHEAGVILSFPNSGTAFEGQYRFGYQTFDVGFRGGIWDPGGLSDAVVLLGVEGRQRVITHTEQFPLDGAIAVGLGGWIVSDASTVFIPVGLSLGRRIDLKNSTVKITPYAEPVLFMTAGSNQETEFHFAFGLGGDFQLSPAFAVRVSGGLGDIEGVSVGAVWIR
jgi:hypothetical protein